MTNEQIDDNIQQLFVGLLLEKGSDILVLTSIFSAN